ncbi:uncharacterized protein YndB with AHSA1/START domain [Saccharopolyspora erythraea NRRL 2338]|uniref:Uncharacterized protein n=2 Tax=Saccharopolyspora erythraea TaxID=1836 RepID=A4F5R1_SACEN|nr:SRPBCC family protein [Saccharopolyspora erythraea]EQD87932.1 hypothetical protein N599_01480 [Saccharopolyspora erythraea D]PFG93185.1 uncharacterized protein YndB with AHSA1/START domain [Saccharopolyspora erythraea NRRL 2338]QRK90046.1 SRPBCC family protein [Saccharopolyspora erythraea]CAL99385.1 hypothetical protein SACE_0032 [Saccharopolyspora erythraea NRRL 2338]
MSEQIELSFDIEATTEVDASPDEVYRVVSDITRMGEWSPECTGGEWLRGQPGAAGSRFHGHNRAGGETWTTECEVVAAVPGREFAWAVLTYARSPEVSVWSFAIEPDGDGCVLTQRYRMQEPPARFASFMRGMDADQAAALGAKRRAMLEDAMSRTVAGIKAAVED